MSPRAFIGWSVKRSQMEQSRICQCAGSFAAQRQLSSPLDAVCIFDSWRRKRTGKGKKGASIIYPILRPVNAKLVDK